MKKYYFLTLFFLILTACKSTDVVTITNQILESNKLQQIHYSGKITGYEIIDYPFILKKGQHFQIRMETVYPNAYFNVFSPKNDNAVFNSSIQGGLFESVAQEYGKYRIRVYLMRAQARRNETAPYRLEIFLGEKA